MVKVRVRVFYRSRVRRERVNTRKAASLSKPILLTELIFVPNDAGDFPTRYYGYKRVHMRSVKRHRRSL